MGKLELVTKFKMEQENEHLQAYKRVFPQARPSIFQMELIEAYVTDAKAWQKTLEFWGSNDYRPQSIGKMLDYYRQVIAGTVQSFEDKTKVSMRIGAAENLAPYVPPPPCRFCGSDVCLKSHEEELREEWRRENAA